ncbi:hypothetical protein CC1G_06921 [Coprinopsis cinerea okayama7|uniref:Uncharacterized protein n=1 Tax=Coprinopsis cinerea (strain Okayama-7 / 130 / ATCC MYA-4618 / FGSC 9003) TaxID=240176 RepID=A8NZP2_COPC7|nr:hypothetical protein CC1G_06921 [Coprinopsis cinerea okayama7\|eukprot:XP_001837715.2 hypothetical protein CC1G_06921 [Coprinopsis cinerea okayama7\
MSMAIHSLLSRDAPSNATATLDSFSEEIKCYNLPYGILGFISHVLTYYTIVCLWFGRKPLWPFSRVSYSRFDLALGGIGLLVSTLLSIVTIIRCREAWQLLVIAIWKMSMSLLNGVTAVHVAILFTMKKIRLKRERKKRPGASREASEDSAVTVVSKDATGEQSAVEEKDEEAAKDGKGEDEKDGDSAPGQESETPISVAIDPLKWVAWWILLYIPGMFAGIVGLMALVVKARDHAGVRKLTAGFYTIVGAGALVVGLGIVCRLRKQNDLGQPERAKRIIVGGLVWIVGSFSILAVFYSDWALGMMAGNLSGLPSGDNSALYWTYWISKRLPMFSL